MSGTGAGLPDGERGTPSEVEPDAAVRGSGVDFRRVARILYRAVAAWPRTRSALVRLKIRMLFPSELGPRISFGPRFLIDLTGGTVAIGADTEFADRCRLVVTRHPPGALHIGERCFFASGVLIGAAKRVVIGNDVLVGEYTSIRDSAHSYHDPTRPINTQPDIRGEVHIGDDVWIGRGCLILGSGGRVTIGRGAVIGANSVVKSDIPEFAVAAGTPARVIRYRR